MRPAATSGIHADPGPPPAGRHGRAGADTDASETPHNLAFPRPTMDSSSQAARLEKPPGTRTLRRSVSEDTCLAIRRYRPSLSKAFGPSPPPKSSPGEPAFNRHRPSSDTSPRRPPRSTTTQYEKTRLDPQSSTSRGSTRPRSGTHPQIESSSDVTHPTRRGWHRLMYLQGPQPSPLYDAW